MLSNRMSRPLTQGGVDGFQNAMLTRHNAFRRAHGVPPLTLDSKVGNDLENMPREFVTPSLIMDNTKLKKQI